MLEFRLFYTVNGSDAKEAMTCTTTVSASIVTCSAVLSTFCNLKPTSDCQQISVDHLPN